jgi:pimeloyl-ACP methyl ester carboxylesterase
MRKRPRLRSTAALIAVGIGGTLVLQGAPAIAADRLPTASPTPAMLDHLSSEAAPSVAPVSGVATPPSAAARTVLFPCKDAPGGLCGRVRVPLDRSEPSRGTVPIFFEYYLHQDPGPAHEAILVTEGGPGFSVTQDPFIGGFYRDMFDPLMANRDLILLDQRGVGRSRAIDCPELQHGLVGVYRGVRACGRQLGLAAQLYGSGDVARDVEAVRRALGIAKLDLYGGSYAAQDVQSYAARFPGHVRSAVLDSPFTTLEFGAPDSEFDDFATDLSRAVPNIADLLCARSESCAADRANAHHDLAWLARRLRRHPVNGVGYDAEGFQHQLHVTESSLAWPTLQGEDFGLTALSEIGAAADALRAGDKVPLLRLAAESDEPGGAFAGDAGDPTQFSLGDNFARFCTDNRFPWDKRAPIPTRRAQWKQARDALPTNRFGLFSVDGWLNRPISPVAPDPCIVWPAAQGHVAPPIPKGAELPGSVPALVLTGDLDLSLPPPDSKPLADLWPHSKYVELVNTEHHTALAGAACADPMIVKFIAKFRTGDTSCATDTHAISFPAVGRFPLTAADARPAAVDPTGVDHSTKADRRVAAATTGAITDALRRGFRQSEPGPGVGLRGGTFTSSFDDSGLSAALDGVRFANDVSVSGTDDYLFDTQAIRAHVTVDAPAAEDGALRVTGVWFGFGVPNTVLRIRGNLGGRRVALQVPAT